MPRMIVAASAIACPTASTLVIGAEALLGALGSAWFLGESLNASGAAACFLVMAGIVLIQIDIPSAIGRLSARLGNPAAQPRSVLAMSSAK